MELSSNMQIVCPIRGLLRINKRSKDGLSASEEFYRVEAIKHLIAKGYPRENFWIALKQVQHTIQIDCLPDVNLVLWLGHVIQQKYQNHSTAKTPSLNFKIGKAHGEVNSLNVLDADKPRIGHGFGEPIALIATGGGAMVIFTVFSQILAADSFIAFLSVGAAEPAAFITQKFHLVLLGICQGVQFVKGLVQPKIQHNIAEILPVHFVKELPEIRQHLCGGGYKIEVRVMNFQIFQQ